MYVRASTGRIIALAALGTRICFKPRHPQLHWVPKVHFRPQHTMICLISLKHWKPTVCTRSQRAPQGWLSCPWQFDLCYFHTMSHILHGFPTNWSGQPSAEKGSFKKNIHPKNVVLQNERGVCGLPQRVLGMAPRQRWRSKGRTYCRSLGTSGACRSWCGTSERGSIWKQWKLIRVRNYMWLSIFWWNPGWIWCDFNPTAFASFLLILLPAIW